MKKENYRPQTRGEGRLYFAYGSNMDENQMAVRCPNSKLLGRAKLSGYRYIIYSRGFASVRPEEGAIVEGLLWAIPQEDEKTLDRYEGIQYNCYTKENMKVMFNEKDTECLVYIGTDDIDGTPGYSYQRLIVDAAKKHALPKDYIEMLESILKKSGSGD